MQRRQRRTVPRRPSSLNLDHDKQTTPPTQHIDLRDRSAHIPTQNAITLQRIEQDGKQLAITTRLRRGPTQPAQSVRTSAGAHHTVPVA